MAQIQESVAPPEARAKPTWTFKSRDGRPKATIDLVVSEGTLTAAGTDLSSFYIIDNNLDPVMSLSFGACEAALGTAGNQFFNGLWEQAAAQGISVFVSAGDPGSAGCDDFNIAAVATHGLAVSGFASTPFNVAVGGTDFDDFTTQTTFWNPSTLNAPGTASRPWVISMRSRGMIPARRLPQARTSVRCARAQQQRTSWAEAAGLAASMRAPFRDTQNLLGKVGSSPTELPQVIIIATSRRFPICERWAAVQEFLFALPGRCFAAWE